ncbi:MAG: hypothetical protein U9P00_07625 [Pseudomonadota bacterium]|nr:hypothetical protein [Pseudomonadota bacterium]
MFFNSGFGNVKKAGLLFFLVTQSMVLQAQAADAPEAAAGSTVASGSEEQQRRFSFPRWPESQQVDRERIPPAPPGPYMSSALSGYPGNGTSFAADNKPAIKFEPSSLPMDAFGPDISWPSNSKTPDRWEPENGYNYVKPAVKKQPYTVMPYNRPPNYNYGYRAPVMNWPGSSSPAMPVRRHQPE